MERIAVVRLLSCLLLFRLLFLSTPSASWLCFCLWSRNSQTSYLPSAIVGEPSAGVGCSHHARTRITHLLLLVFGGAAAAWLGPSGCSCLACPVLSRH